MAHQPSAHEIKRGRRSLNSRDVPRDGTKIRAVYDLLMANRGRWVDVRPLMTELNVAHSGPGAMMTAFTNSYGLDVRCCYGRWLLAGEWISPRVYVNYVNEVYDDDDSTDG